MNHFPAVDPIPLAAPVWLQKLLHVVTLALHFVAVEMLLAGLLLAILLGLFRKSPHSLVTARAASVFMPRGRIPAMQPARMRRQFHAALGLFPVTLLLIVLSAPSTFAATKVVTDAANGASVEIKMGDVLQVRLSSNPSTGYMWYVHKQSTALLKLVSQSQTEAGQPGVGRPIVQIFEFAPKAAGAGVLLLHYVRSWEKPDPEEKQFSLHVTIE